MVNTKRPKTLLLENARFSANSKGQFAKKIRQIVLHVRQIVPNPPVCGMFFYKLDP